MKIILHGKLARSVGASEFEIHTKVPADAIEGLSRQCPSWPRDMVIDVVDFDTEEKLRGETTTNELHLVPALEGGSGVGRIIVGIAVIAAIVFSGGTWTPLALMVLSIGTSLVLSGVMTLFYKAPTLNNPKDGKDETSKILGNNGNTTQIGTFRTLAWGRNRIGGHWLSLQVDAKSIISGRFPTSPPA